MPNDSRRVFLAGAAAFLANQILPGKARAESPDIAAAANFVQTLVRNIIEDEDLSRKQGLSEQQKLGIYLPLFNGDFDVPFICRFVMGSYWKQLSEDEKKQFTDVFSTYTVLSISERFPELVGKPFRIDKIWAKDNGLTVNSTIETGSGRRGIPVVWYLAKTADSFKIYDLQFGDLHMVIYGRDNIRGIIERNGGNARDVIPSLRQLIDGRLAGNDDVHALDNRPVQTTSARPTPVRAFVNRLFQSRAVALNGVSPLTPA